MVNRSSPQASKKGLAAQLSVKSKRPFLVNGRMLYVNAEAGRAIIPPYVDMPEDPELSRNQLMYNIYTRAHGTDQNDPMVMILFYKVTNTKYVRDVELLEYTNAMLVNAREGTNNYAVEILTYCRQCLELRVQMNKAILGQLEAFKMGTLQADLVDLKDDIDSVLAPAYYARYQNSIYLRKYRALLSILNVGYSGVDFAVQGTSFPSIVQNPNISEVSRSCYQYLNGIVNYYANSLPSQADEAGRDVMFEKAKQILGHLDPAGFGSAGINGTTAIYTALHNLAMNHIIPKSQNDECPDVEVPDSYNHEERGAYLLTASLDNSYRPSFYLSRRGAVDAPIPHEEAYHYIRQSALAFNLQFEDATVYVDHAAGNATVRTKAFEKWDGIRYPIDDIEYKLDPVSGLVTANGDIYRFLSKPENHRELDKQQRHFRQALINFAIDYATNYYMTYTHKLERRLINMYTPYNVRAHFIYGLFQPIEVATRYIESPFSFPEFSWLRDRLIHDGNGEYINTRATDNKFKLSVIALCDLHDMLNTPATPGIDRRHFIFALLSRCIAEVSESGLYVFRERYNLVQNAISVKRKNIQNDTRFEFFNKLTTGLSMLKQNNER